MCRYRVPMNQTHRVSQCGCHHKQQSCPEVSNPALGQRCARCLGARQTLDSSECRILWRSCPARSLGCGCLRSSLSRQHGPKLLERCDLEQQLFFQVRALCDPTYADLQRLAGWLLRAPSGGRYTASKYRHQPRGQGVHPRFYHIAFWGTYGPLPLVGLNF